MFRRFATPVVVLIALFATSCGGADAEEAAAPLTSEPEAPEALEEIEEVDEPQPAESAEAPPETEPDDDKTDEERALEFTACMRDQGIDMEDPTVDADGSVNLFGGGQGRGGPGQFGEDFQPAFEVCQDRLEGATFVRDFDQTEIEDQLLSFAECLREQGIEVDDPDFSGFGAGGGGGRGIFGDAFDPQDPANADAIGVCQGEITIGRP